MAPARVSVQTDRYLFIWPCAWVFVAVKAALVAIERVFIAVAPLAVEHDSGVKASAVALSWLQRSKAQELGHGLSYPIACGISWNRAEPVSYTGRRIPYH